MRVSIIVTSYNYRDYVAESIRSALDQTYPNTEVIVVDDGSTDGSVDVVRQFSGRVQTVFKANAGQASAFNVGWKMATGDIVFFLDCDDVLKPDAVESVVRAWRAGFSKVHFPLEVTDANLRPIGAVVPRAPLPQGDLSGQMLRKGIYICPPNSGNVFSRTFLSKVLPMPEKEWIQGADTYLLGLAPFYGEIGAVHTPLCFYRTHAASVCNIATKFEPRKLVRLLESDIHLRQTLERSTQQLGLKLSPEAALSHWLHFKMRLASCKLAGALHPFPGDRVWRVASRLIRAVYASDDMSTPMRAAFTAWAVAVAGLPRAASEPLVKLAFSPGNRPAFLRLLLRRGTE